MKLTVFLLLVSVAGVIANKSYSQTKMLKLDMREATVKEVLKSIEEQSEFYFLYSENLIDVKREVNITIENKKIEEVLNLIFEGTDVEYSIRDRFIVLTKPEVFNGNLQALQQQKSISGKVTDSGGVPLPGVTVLIEGSTNGTITNEDGEYILKDIPMKGSLQFSFIGMRTQSVQISGKTVIDVIMEEESIGIDEVVAVGYGTMKKSDLTGSVVRVNMEGKDQAANVELGQSLQGYLPGLNVSASTGAGGTSDITVRGQTSLSASDSPLIVRDGIIFNGSLSEINVNDIESVDVLKDASAAAVYGSRSANGVIIITTKRGKTEKPMFSFNSYVGFQTLSNTVHDHVMNADQYAIRLVDYYYYLQDLLPWYKTSPTSASERPERADITDREVVATYLRSEEEKNNYLEGNEIDWVDEVLRVAPVQSYSLSISGKTKRTNYFLSGSYTDQQGIQLNDDFQRTTMNVNLENEIAKWLTIGVNSNYSHLDYSGIAASIGSALSATPLANMYGDDGNYLQCLCSESYMVHPLAQSKMGSDLNLQDKINVAFNGTIYVPKVKGLTYTFNYAKYLSYTKHNQYIPSAITTDGGEATKAYTEERDWSMNNILNYKNSFGLHKVDLTLLATRENREGETSDLTATGFDIETLTWDAMELGSELVLETGAWEENSIAFMGRINYVYNDRYLLTATIRRDGYSGFGANHKWGNFPSLSLGWILTEEPFMQDIDVVNFMKLRVSYGLNGNQGIGRYASQSSMSSDYYNFDGEKAISLTSSSLGNADLGWESTASFNVGMDYSLLNQRISGSIDVYTAKTTDVLVSRSIPEATSYSSVYDNLGGINNKGIELSLSTINIKNSNFKWESRFMFSLNRNKITALYNDITEDTGNSWFVGHNINSIYGYTNGGVWQEEDLFNGNILDGFYPGQYIVKDISGEDGEPDGDISADYDRSIQGSKDPNYRVGIENTLSYKNFTFSFFLNSIQGGNGYYQTSVSYVAGGTDSAYRTNQTAIKPYWTPQNPTNNTPAMYYSPSYSPKVLESKSFVRLQDISLSYNFSKALLKSVGIDNAQLYVSGKNLYIWTDCTAWDPENSSPVMRSVITGLKLSF